jgi:two-component system, chemotaxis family, response regulator Rcp1
MSATPYQILLVEDNPDDVWLIQRAFRDSHPPCIVHVAEDGVEATAFLRQQGDYVDAPRPDLILLDLNLPKKDGSQVLAEIKADERLKHIPVIILTSSDSEEDIFRSYANHANSYIQKPNMEPFSLKLRKVADYWLTTAKLPRDSQSQFAPVSQDGKSAGNQSWQSGD